LSLCKLTGSTTSEATVRPSVVVVHSKRLNRALRVLEIEEPVLIQALVAETTVEALDEAVLRTPRWHIEPLRVTPQASGFYEDGDVVPPGSVAFDCALVIA
jgi:hypothetical protein